MELISKNTNKVIHILTWTFGILAIAAGADKFVHLLTNWDKYLAPIVTDILPISGHLFMKIVGVIEIIAGILVFARPHIGSIIVSLWLFGIAVNLVLTGQYFDIAVRDIVMSISAFCLFLLTSSEKRI